MRRAKGSDSKSPGACASLLTRSRVPDARASAATCPLVSECPRRAESSSHLPLRCANWASFRTQQTRVHQRVHVIGLQRRAVGAGRDRLGDGLAMDRHELGAGLRRAASHRVDLTRRHVRDLNARDGDDAPRVLRDAAIARQGRHERLDVGRARMIRDGNGGISRDVTAPQELDRRQLAVAEERMRVEVEEHEGHSELDGVALDSMSLHPVGSMRGQRLGLWGADTGGATATWAPVL